jgi:uncharacterized membrane protein
MCLVLLIPCDHVILHAKYLMLIGIDILSLDLFYYGILYISYACFIKLLYLLVYIFLTERERERERERESERVRERERERARESERERERETARERESERACVRACVCFLYSCIINCHDVLNKSISCCLL